MDVQAEFGQGRQAIAEPSEAGDLSSISGTGEHSGLEEYSFMSEAGDQSIISETSTVHDCDRNPAPPGDKENFHDDELVAKQKRLMLKISEVEEGVTHLLREEMEGLKTLLSVGSKGLIGGVDTEYDFKAKRVGAIDKLEQWLGVVSKVEGEMTGLLRTIILEQDRPEKTRGAMLEQRLETRKAIQSTDSKGLEEALQRLQSVKQNRLKPLPDPPEDPSFDKRLDDDEVFIDIFTSLGHDKSGKISVEDLMKRVEHILAGDVHGLARAQDRARDVLGLALGFNADSLAKEFIRQGREGGVPEGVLSRENAKKFAEKLVKTVTSDAADGESSSPQSVNGNQLKKFLESDSKAFQDSDPALLEALRIFVKSCDSSGSDKADKGNQEFDADCLAKELMKSAKSFADHAFSAVVGVKEVDKQPKFATRAQLEKWLSDPNSSPVSGAPLPTTLIEALSSFAASLPASHVDFSTFRQAMRKLPRATGRRVTWVREMGLEAMLARHLPPGTIIDGLAGLTKSGDGYHVVIDQAMKAFAVDAQTRVKAALEELKKKPVPTAFEANSKFEFEEGYFKGCFASIDDFYRGAEKVIKMEPPNPDIGRGILHDLTGHPSCKELFVTPNYFIATNLLLEFFWAVDPDFEGPEFPVVEEQEEKNRLSSLRDEAKNFLNDIRSVRLSGDTASGRLLFPGEVGDSFDETWVLLSITPNAQNSTIQDTLDKIKKSPKSLVESKFVDLLATAEEKARGVRFLKHSECLEWIVKKRLIASPEEIKAEVASKERFEQAVHLAVVLPMSKARAEQVLAESNPGQNLQTRIQEALHAAVGTEVKSSVVSVINKVVRYCQYVHIEDVKDVAVSKWLEDDLQPAFGDALQKAERSDLKEVQKALIKHGWNLPVLPQGETEINAWISDAAKEMNTLERWNLVADWVALFHKRVQGRSREGLKTLREKKENEIKEYNLKPGEVLAAYIYTGPCYLPFNSVYREYPPEMVKLLKGSADKRIHTKRNTLSTVLFCISSALVKLGRHTKVPETGKVYRGLGKMLLPSQFWTEHQDFGSDCPPWKGGVEKAFMSTTTDKDVALRYSSFTGTVVEISVGRVQIGGELGWLSMVRCCDAL